MSRKGNCWDTTVAKSFFATLESELIDRQIFKPARLLGRKWRTITTLKSAMLRHLESTNSDEPGDSRCELAVNHTGTTLGHRCAAAHEPDYCHSERRV